MPAADARFRPTARTPWFIPLAPAPEPEPAPEPVLVLVLVLVPVMNT